MTGIVSVCFNIAVCIGVPITALVFVGKRWKGGVKLFFIGVGTFFISQICIRQPVFAVLQQTAWFQAFSAQHMVAFYFLLALTAGLAEECARYIAFRLLKKFPEPETAVPLCCGLGHGGFEAFLIGINNLLLLVLSEYLSQLGWAAALAGVERLSTMLVHVAFSFIVYRAVRSKRLRFLLLAILLHTVCDFSIILVQYGLPAIAMEGILLAYALILIFAVLKTEKRGNIASNTPQN